MKKSLILTIILLVTTICHSQQVVELRADSCLYWALEHQVKVKNAQLDLEQAQLVKQGAFSKYFPHVKGMALAFHSADYLVDLNTTDMDADGVHVQLGGYNLDNELQLLLDRVNVEAGLQMLDHGVAVNVMAIQPVYMGGRIVNGNRLANLGIDASRLQLQLAQEDVELQVEEAYWMVVGMLEKRQMVESLQQMLDTLFRDVSSASEAGVMGHNDLLKVQLKQSELRSAHLQLSNGIQLATMALLQKIGKPYNDSIHYLFADSLVVEPLRLDLSPETNVSNRKEAKLLDISVNAERLKSKMQVGENLPQLMFGATYGYNNLLHDRFAGNGLLFATLNVPISDWWEGSKNIQKQYLEEQKAVNTQQETLQMMQIQMRQAQQQVIENYQQLMLQQEAYEVAKEHYDETGDYFEAGMIGVSEYLEAQSLLQTSKSNLTDQKIQYRLALLRWNLLNR